MSKTVQLKRGNANVSATYIGAQGEITVNTDNYTLNVHDGLTPGGYSILNTNVGNIGNLVVTNQTIFGTIPNVDITLSPNNANIVLTSNLVTPNIEIVGYTIKSVNTGSSLTLPADSDNVDVELLNTAGNIKFTTYNSLTNAPYTLTLGSDGDFTLPGYIKSTLGSSQIQFAGGQGLLLYADFTTGHTGIGLDEFGTTDIFANNDIRITTDNSSTGYEWLFRSNGQLFTRGNISTANLLISHTAANNTVQARTLANSDLQLSATNGTQISSIYLWANNQRMSFNTVSNAFDFNFNGQLSATDFTASKNSAYGYSFYAEGMGYSGFKHTSGPPDYISINHEGNVFTKFFSNGTTDIIGNLRVTSDGVTYGTFPDAYVQVYSNVNSYSQFVLQNISDGESASTDVVLTSDNGNDTSYYVDLGITGSNHVDPDFFGDTTAVNDAYLYVTGYDQVGPSLGNVGNLIIGSTNGVVKTFIGNTAEANVVTIVNSTGLLPGANVVYDLGSEANQWKDLWLSNSTIYLGGVPITVTANGQLSVNGSVISGNAGGGGNYDNSNVAAYLPTYEGNIAANIVKNGQSWTFDGTSTGSLTLPASSVITEIANPGGFPGYALVLTPDPSNAVDADQKLLLYPTGGQDFNHLHLTTGNLYNTELYLGNDNLYVKLSNTGNVVINSDDNTGNTAQWTFGADGNLVTSSNLVFGSAPGSGSSILQYDAPLQMVGEGANSAVVIGWAANVNVPDSIAVIGFNTPYPNGASNVIIASGNNATVVNYWNFDNTGNLSAPGNINAEGTVTADGLIIDTVAGITVQFGDVDIQGFTGLGGNLNALAANITGNVTAGYFIGNGSLLTGITATANYDNTNVTAFLGSYGSNTIVTTGNITSGNINANVNGFAIGYRDIPQIVFTSNSTLALTDAGKHYYSANSANVITIPNNTTVSFNIGSAISIIQQGTANLTLTPDAGVTLYLAGNSTSSSRMLGNYGMATLMKVATDTWFINGTGLT